MAMHLTEARREGLPARLGHTALEEFRKIVPPTVFFFVGFNLILFTKRLILADHLIQFTGFLVATTAALIVGKVVLVADKLPILRRFDYAPLAAPILFKSAVYTVLVALARLIEALIHFLVKGGSLGGGRFLDDVMGKFDWNQFIATQLWVFVLFVIYVTASELNQLLGDGEFWKVFFKRRSSQLKSTRRARIRLLVRLSKLTEAHRIEEFRDPEGAPYRELVVILKNLAGAEGPA